MLCASVSVMYCGLVSGTISSRSSRGLNSSKRTMRMPKFVSQSKPNSAGRASSRMIRSPSAVRSAVGGRNGSRSGISGASAAIRAAVRGERDASRMPVSSSLSVGASAAPHAATSRPSNNAAAPTMMAFRALRRLTGMLTVRSLPCERLGAESEK